MEVSCLVDEGWKAVLLVKDRMVILGGIPADELIVSVSPVTVDGAWGDALVA